MAARARSTATFTLAARRQRRSVPPIAASAASRTFSCTLSSGKTLDTWNVRPSPSRVRSATGWFVMSRPERWIEPAVGRYSPDRRLKSDVLPAPFGPMIPSSSPSATSRLTSATIFAPPMSSPRLRVARIGGFMPRVLRSLLFERGDGRLDVAGRDRLEDLHGEMAAGARNELHLEHRLQHRVILRTDPLLALGCEELPALERRDLLRGVHAALGKCPTDHLRGDEAVRCEEIGHGMAVLGHPFDEGGVHRVARSLVDVMRKQRHTLHERADRVITRPVREPGDDRHLLCDALLLQGLPHRCRVRRVRPRDE